jgi:branched chain amino acid aminotransferase apoenzyme (EC 2.6.1.42)
MSLVVYLDGQFLKKEEARISVFDRGVLYGDGIFEGIRAYNNRVFKLKEHIDRLYESAKAILLNIPIDKQEMMNVVLETLRRNNLREAYIRGIL